MSDSFGLLSIRNSLFGADRATRFKENVTKGPVRPVDSAGQPWPLMPLGHADGVFHFLDVKGQHRALTARQLGARHDLLSLFGGDDQWLRAEHPKKVSDGSDPPVWRTIDFKVNDAAASLQRACFAAGLWGDHIRLRQPGIWRDRNGDPVVHCGDEVYLHDEWVPAGVREDNQIWIASAATPRPEIPCGSAVARHIYGELVRLWCWRDVGAPAAVLGLICNAYYNAALDWRPSAFISGDTGGGKSALEAVVRGALPLHHYDNDTTKPGIEQAVHGRAMPIIIDEASDRSNRSASRDLADLILSASTGEGTRGSRGTVDGKGRRIELSGLIMMFSINPPDLEPQHLGRMMQIELTKPEAGADHRSQHRALAAFARENGGALWGRALAGWDRYQVALERFREGLGKAGCAAREMDQAGALLAGYWVMVEEELPDDRGVRMAISTLHGDGRLSNPGLIRSAAETDADSRPRRMLQHLMSSMIHLHRSSEREPVGLLIDIAFGERTDMLRDAHDARVLLSNHGIRIIMKCQGSKARERGETCDCTSCKDRRGPVPRKSDAAGAWFARQNPELKKLFTGTPFEGDRWQHEMLRLPTAGRSVRNVRIGSTPPGSAIWLSRSELQPADDAEEAAL